MLEKVLVANRGEIALRIVRACRELGVPSVAVYSEEDAGSAAAVAADEAWCIGPAPAKRSYLNIPAIVEVAKATGATAVHPGYGFLSEDPDFAEVCANEGLVFIGPPAATIALLGDKSSARRTMSVAGLPMLPGGLEPIATADEARALADSIGYPVIVKAVAGGGGRGMHVADGPDQVAGIFRSTRAEAQKLFGDSRVYVERYLPVSRHVEVQILVDAHGHGVHLGTRDCSTQRRHQKLLEEGPAPALPPGLLDRMGEVSVKGAIAAGYVGAGTFEYLVDQEDEFSFMEVNCRLQVEHPVTEMITGLDLVREQMRIAAGGRLACTQDDVTITGHAVECRINIEDPDRGFLPTPGRIDAFVPPAGPFVRVDSHAYSGYEVPPHYDSLLAKVVAWAPDRDQALDRMDRALDEMVVRGPTTATTAPFLREVLADPAFRAATHSTDIVGRLRPDQA